MQLLASVPKEHADLFWERLLFHNLRRVFVQSILVILVDICSILIYLTKQSTNEWLGPYTGILILQIAVMIIAVFVCYKTSYNPRAFGDFAYYKMDVVYVASYLAVEFIIFLFSFQDVGSFLRLVLITFVASNATILSQKKLIPMLLGFYLTVQMTSFYWGQNEFLYSNLFTFNLWLACVCSILISCGAYSLFVNQFLANMDTEQVNAELEISNNQLEMEVQRRATLLNMLNDIAGVLLNADTENSDSILLECMKKTAVAMDVEHVCLWKNQGQSRQMYCAKAYEWGSSSSSELLKKTLAAEELYLPDEWMKKLSQAQCVGGIVDEFPELMQEQLRGQIGAEKIVSIIGVPVFLYDQFWGFAAYADCKNKRYFSEIEEDILRTISLLYATSVVHNEITLELVEASAEALENSKAKSRFLANMSHEIRTPINAITGMSSIAREAEDKKQILRCLDHIDVASKQLLAVINDVLDMSKIEAGKMELMENAFEILPVLHNVQSIIGVQAAQKGLQLLTEFDSSLPEVVIGDAVRLSQILINLLSNAVKFTPAGGEIYFAARRIHIDPQGMDEFEFVVKDTGIGIAPENQLHLFDAFEQVNTNTTVAQKFGGTGLGLAISQSIAKIMHGAIELTSELGIGSCFTARVLIQQGNREMLQPGYAKLQTEYDFSDYYALLVEDVEINREIAIAMLAGTGLKIDIAEDGKSAVDMVCAQPDRYDIVLMDVQMPVMNGYDATRAIRSMDFPRAKSLPIVAMSANAFSEDIRKCLDLGMNDHVAKPVDYAELIFKIGKYLRGQDRK